MVVDRADSATPEITNIGQENEDNVETYEIARIVASGATAIGVVIAAWQIWRNAEQTKTSFEDSLNKEYRELMRPIPLAILLGQIASPEESAKAREHIYNYLDFCNQQVYLRKCGRIRKDSWLEWQEGMEINFELPLFKEVMNEVFSKMPTIFQELRNVREENYKCDPSAWRG
jgi:hypothetical protein